MNLHQHEKHQFIPSIHSSVLWPDRLCLYSFLGPMTRQAMPVFDHVYPKFFWSTSNFSELVSTCIKSGYFIDLFWRYGQWKNPAICLAENKNVSHEQKFPKYGICTGTQQIRTVFIRPIIVNFSFIVISCTRSLMQHAVIIWLFGKNNLSLYDKNRFIFTIYFYIVCLLYSWNLCFLQ